MLQQSALIASVPVIVLCFSPTKIAAEGFLVQWAMLYCPTLNSADGCKRQNILHVGDQVRWEVILRDGTIGTRLIPEIVQEVDLLVGHVRLEKLGWEERCRCWQVDWQVPSDATEGALPYRLELHTTDGKSQVLKPVWTQDPLIYVSPSH